MAALAAPDLARSTLCSQKQLWQEKISAEQDYLAAQQTLREAEIAVANAQQKLVALGASALGTVASTAMDPGAFRRDRGEKHIALGEAVKEDASIFTPVGPSSVWGRDRRAGEGISTWCRVGEKVVVRATAFDSTAEGQIFTWAALLGRTAHCQGQGDTANPKMAWRPGLFVNGMVSGRQKCR